MSASAQTVASPVLSDGLGPMDRLERFQNDPHNIDIVCQRVIDGESLGQIAKSLGLPKLRFIRWIGEEYSSEYESALRMAADEHAHQLIPLADESDPDESQKTKLQMEARRFVASRWDKSRYGEHTKVEHTGNVNLIALLGSLPKGDAPQVLEEKVVEALPAPAAESVEASEEYI